MKRATLLPGVVFATVLVCLCCDSWALDITWTRMTGQNAVESAVRIVDLDGDGQESILAVNRGGQIMLWGLDGNDVGDGQDGTVVQLPEGLWSSAPATPCRCWATRACLRCRMLDRQKSGSVWMDTARRPVNTKGPSR